jgi:hypothetical protein
LSPSLKQVAKEFKGELGWHLGKKVSQLNMGFKEHNLDLVFIDLLAKPSSLDGIVFTSSSELRRQCSCKNKHARIVFMDRFVHGAGISVVVIWLLNSDGNSNFINKSNDGEKAVTVTS